MSPWKSSQEGTLLSWLIGSVAGIRPKNTHVNTGTLFIGLDFQKRILAMTYVVSSHRIHHLPEIWDDTFDVMAWAMPFGRNIKRHSPAHDHRTMLFYGGVTKAGALATHVLVLTSTERSAVYYRTTLTVTHVYTCK